MHVNKIVRKPLLTPPSKTYPVHSGGFFCLFLRPTCRLIVVWRHLPKALTHKDLRDLAVAYGVRLGRLRPLLLLVAIACNLLLLTVNGGENRKILLVFSKNP
jgi:hypothetical protein